MKKLLFILFILSLVFNVQSVLSKKTKEKPDETKQEEKQIKKEEINETEFDIVKPGKLLAKPQDFIGKKIKFRGKFSSFTTLALDYKEAMRDSKDYISICIFRPDSSIPLSELKLAYPVKEAKENTTLMELEENDLIEIYGKVFSAALDEPWVDILAVKLIESAKPKEKEIDQKAEEKSIKKDEGSNN